MKINHKRDRNRNTFLSVFFSSIIFTSCQLTTRISIFKTWRPTKNGVACVDLNLGVRMLPMFRYFWCWKMLQEVTFERRYKSEPLLAWQWNILTLSSLSVKWDWWFLLLKKKKILFLVESPDACNSLVKMTCATVSFGLCRKWGSWSETAGVCWSGWSWTLPDSGTVSAILGF